MLTLADLNNIATTYGVPLDLATVGNNGDYYFHINGDGSRIRIVDVSSTQIDVQVAVDGYSHTIVIAEPCEIIQAIDDCFHKIRVDFEERIQRDTAAAKSIVGVLSLRRD